jgi:hypothetical protein
MTSYGTRRKLKQARLNANYERALALSKSHTDKVILTFEGAYVAYFSRKPQVTYKNGWFRVRWLGNFRERNLLAMADKMWAELHEETLGK